MLNGSFAVARGRMGWECWWRRFSEIHSTMEGTRKKGEGQSVRTAETGNKAVYLFPLGGAEELVQTDLVVSPKTTQMNLFVIRSWQQHWHCSWRELCTLIILSMLWRRPQKKQ